MLQSLISAYQTSVKGIHALHPLFELVVRCYVAWMFLKSGLVKIQSWDTTLMLFEYEYTVPLLSPYWAALLGTAAELTLPVLLIIGLGGRLSALALFIFNIVAVISYPDISPAGVQQHMLWGFMLLMLFVYGVGKWSADYFVQVRYINNRRS